MAVFADLPVEMVSNVFAFVRQRPDQCAVCLVSRSWNDIMAPIMWEKLEIDLGRSGDSRLTRLLDTDPGFLPHVRELKILVAGPWWTNPQDDLTLLITALPRDQLRTISCKFRVQNSTFRHLLKSQRKLEGIDVDTAVMSLGPTSGSQRAWSASMMSGVKQARFFLTLKEGHAEETFENLRKALDAYPTLEDLNLSDASLSADSLQDILFFANGGQLFSKLTSVTLDSMDLVPAGSRPFSHNFDVTKLQQLRLKNCHSLIYFLDSLTKSYSEISGVLKMLLIELSLTNDKPKKTIRSIERFLKACPKLEDLFLALHESGCVGKDCLLAHADTLRSLVVGNDPAEEPVYFSKRDLRSIMKACKKLERLAIDFPPVSLRSMADLGRDFHLNGTEEDNEELEGVLAELAQYSTLHTLGMLNRPKLAFPHITDKNGDDSLADDVIHQLHEVAMQNFANQVLRYMAKQGLPPNVFHIEAIATYGTPSGAIDRSNECRYYHYKYAHYTYTSGRVQDRLGANVVVAVPLRDAYREFPDNFIIQNATL